MCLRIFSYTRDVFGEFRLIGRRLYLLLFVCILQIRPFHAIPYHYFVESRLWHIILFRTLALRSRLYMPKLRDSYLCTHTDRQTNTISETVKQLNQEFWFDFNHNLWLYVIRLSHIILHLSEFYNPASVLHVLYASHASCAVLVRYTGNATNATGCLHSAACPCLAVEVILLYSFYRNRSIERSSGSPVLDLSFRQTIGQQ